MMTLCNESIANRVIDIIVSKVRCSSRPRSNYRGRFGGCNYSLPKENCSKNMLRPFFVASWDWGSFMCCLISVPSRFQLYFYVVFLWDCRRSSKCWNDRMQRAKRVHQIDRWNCTESILIQNKKKCWSGCLWDIWMIVKLLFYIVWWFSLVV